MDSAAATIRLRPEHFGEAEHELAAFGGLTATTFRYSTGVPALRIANALGHITTLPWQGQQIWDATFHGRALGMRSMFDEPRPTQDYLGTYGGFLIHCGAVGMGAPGPEDRHALHGELPNAPYRDAALLLGRDARGPFMALTGRYQHTVAFNHNYVARPLVRLHAGSSRIEAELVIDNLRHAPMELLYLAHINFRTVDDALLVDSVPPGDQHMRLRPLPGGRFKPTEAYLRMFEAMRAEPGRHRRMARGQVIDPELVLYLDAVADAEGWSHALQLLPDGSADFVAHRPDQLDKVIRWICRNDDQNALGLVLPATAEDHGYTAEKAKGNLRIVPPGGQWRCDLAFGALAPAEAAAMRQAIEATVRRHVGG
jgi:hypothetical protein